MLQKYYWLHALLFLFFSCKSKSPINILNKPTSTTAKLVITKVYEIPLPNGYKRLPATGSSFAYWLRNIIIKSNKTVFLYNGLPKNNQNAQFAVLDISLGAQDLQQCADAVMRLRAEYFFALGQYDSICFTDNHKKQYKWQGKNDKTKFENYLNQVFGMCGSASLEAQLKPTTTKDIKPGDVFVKGGFPGHAVIVIDVAENKTGDKIFMLAQSYMPAQDLHILNNYQTNLPWYQLKDTGLLNTPEWTFNFNQLKTW